ncbi:MAG: hypothetical protein N3F65_04025 [Nitrososphaeria archaeon]|nr:hypothetical protein [Nitrososphaeria archaeon]MDW8021750.1 hypothetical protein [Nitrososphaerota archaeon]
MLTKKDFERIVKEVDGLRGRDAVEFLKKTSPWFDPIEPAVRRVSEGLRRIEAFYVLHGLRALPLYGVPYISREIEFAVKFDEGGFESRLVEMGFRKLSVGPEMLTLLDLQSNRVVRLSYRPGALEWDEEFVERAREKMDTRILSAEDYAVSLIARRQSTMRLELAAKVIYSNMDQVDRGYLEKRAAKFSVDDVIRRLFSGLEEASNR